MEFDGHEQDHEETGNPNYEPAAVGGDGASRKTGISYRYRECLKNHAVGIGGHAVDGCGEFIAAGEEGTLDALSCAACNCHRNFHRKEPDGGGGQGFQYHRGAPPPQPQHHLHHHQHIPYYRTAAAPSGYLQVAPQQSRPPPLALPPSSTSREEEDVSNPSSSGGGGGGGSKKRFRTKFSQEQKDRMLGFAERIGWRIQKHDEAAVEQFCEEMGVKRQVLKVWMHNNKHTLGKKP